MLISPTMNLANLSSLMGKRHSIKNQSLFASEKEASDLRDILVRDYPSMDTDDILGEKWHVLCCAVDPAEQL